jgi:GMP synthase (glutamine-hydrolysing)
MGVKTSGVESMGRKRLLIVNNERDFDDLGWIPRIREAIAAIEPVEFIVMHFSDIDKNSVQFAKPDLIILTGRATHHWDMEEILQSYTRELEFIRQTEVPTLGICAGIELISVAYGNPIGKMVNGEDDILEEGYVQIDILQPVDALFKGLDSSFRCCEMHREEVKVLPPDFECLASNQMCKIQTIKHKELPLYGVQFHPEWYNDEYPDGKAILANFLNLAN